MSKTYKIAVLGGDGTGPEVAREGVKVLQAAAAKYDFKLDLTDFDFGGDRYIKTGEVLPDSASGELAQFDSIFLGAIGHPDVKPGILEKGILLRLRFELDQYINLRPVKLYPGVETPIKDKGPAEIDYVVVRENSGGIYTGTGGISQKGTPHEVAVQSMVYNRFQVERCLRYAYDYAERHGKKARGKGEENTLGLVGKTNVLTYVFDLWERAFNEIGEQDYADVRRDYYHVDATCMWMVKSPEWFDVLVTGNMFGDIISDECAMITGSMGMLCSASLNASSFGLYEPAGGSAPDIAGMGIANPIAQIQSAAMMLRYSLKQTAAADAIDAAVAQVLNEGIFTGDIAPEGAPKVDTVAMGKAIADRIAG